MSLWIRLDVDFDETEWLAFLSPLAQFAWIKLLCHVKTQGPKTGRVQLRSAAVWAKNWGIGAAEPVREMLEAALNAKALLQFADEIVIASWLDYQSPGAERMRKHRTAHDDARECHEPEEDQELRNSDAQEPLGDAQSVTKGVGAHALSCTTETETETSSEEANASSAGRSNPLDPCTAKPNHPIQVSGRCNYQVAEALREEGLDWPDPTFDEVRRYAANEGPLWRLVDEDGEDGAVELYLLAARSWRTPPNGWDPVWRNRRTLRMERDGATSIQRARDLKVVSGGGMNGTLQDVGRTTMEAIYGTTR